MATATATFLLGEGNHQESCFKIKTFVGEKRLLLKGFCSHFVIKTYEQL